MGQLLVKDGVDFGTSLAFAGARLLEVIKHVVKTLPFDVTITSARDGVHSSPKSAHYQGEAFDLRVHSLTMAQRDTLLHALKAALYASSPRRFYCVLKARGTPQAHLHVQRRMGTTYTIHDYLQDA